MPPLSPRIKIRRGPREGKVSKVSKDFRDWRPDKIRHNKHTKGPGGSPVSGVWSPTDGRRRTEDWSPTDGRRRTEDWRPYGTEDGGSGRTGGGQEWRESGARVAD